jgi:hypothetical protein
MAEPQGNGGSRFESGLVFGFTAFNPERIHIGVEAVLRTGLH